MRLVNDNFEDTYYIAKYTKKTYLSLITQKKSNLQCQRFKFLLMARYSDRKPEEQTKIKALQSEVKFSSFARQTASPRTSHSWSCRAGSGCVRVFLVRTGRIFERFDVLGSVRDFPKDRDLGKRVRGTRLTCNQAMHPSIFAGQKSLPRCVIGM